MYLSIEDSIMISSMNEILKLYGFPYRDTHNEPDNYDEKYWHKKASNM